MDANGDTVVWRLCQGRELVGEIHEQERDFPWFRWADEPFTDD
ncbi:MAG TPA: hypothetical protein VGD43_07185 [Micromonospora sp.]